MLRLWPSFGQYLFLAACQTQMFFAEFIIQIPFPHEKHTHTNKKKKEKQQVLDKPNTKTLIIGMFQ